MLDLSDNKVAFLGKRPKLGFIVVMIILVILIMFLIYICGNETYDNYQTKGIVSCDGSCVIKTAIPSNLDNFEQIALNNKMINYEIVSRELVVDEDNYQTYYEISFETDKTLTNNEVVSLNFYYNKQRIITKIKEKMF